MEMENSFFAHFFTIYIYHSHTTLVCLSSLIILFVCLPDNDDDEVYMKNNNNDGDDYDERLSLI